MLSSTILQIALATASATSAPSEFPTEAREAYARVLDRHVENGRVDYVGLEKRSLHDLDAFIAAVAKAELPALRSERIGLLVDAYNALVLRSVIHHGRPRSVLDVKGFFKNEVHTVAGKKVSLDALEKKVLNPFAKDPRTHFVLVCAAVGCPILESTAFLGSSIDKRFDAATRRYLASPHGARASETQLAVSKIFDWYAKDFGGKEGVARFVREHLSAKARNSSAAVTEVTFFDYNWTLNQQ